VVELAKTLNLPLRVYEDLIHVSEELSFMAKKPISLSMTVDLLMEIYRAHLSNPCALDTFSQQMRSLDLMLPEEFDKYWDDFIDAETDRRVQSRKR